MRNETLNESYEEEDEQTQLITKATEKNC